MNENLVEVMVNGQTMKWYRFRGYDIPVRTVQLYLTKDGIRRKHGIARRVANGTKILVKRQDLKPGSNQVLDFVCETCGKSFTTDWQSHKKKISNNCKSCQAKKGFKGGCQDYWSDKLINNNSDAKCDISGETDKRFLELYHLLSKKLGGKNEELNYVVLSANYHTAFHRWADTRKATTPEQYQMFKKQQADILTDDWDIVK